MAHLATDSGLIGRKMGNGSQFDAEMLRRRANLTKLCLERAALRSRFEFL
jgi:hypothetical protein